MKTQICALLSLTLFALPVSADSVEDLDKWFRDGYAALYIANAWDRADEFAQYFAEEIEYRSDNGLIKMDVNSRPVKSSQHRQAKISQVLRCVGPP